MQEFFQIKNPDQLVTIGAKHKMFFLIAALFYRASESHGFTASSDITLLTHTGMGSSINTPYDTPGYNTRAQRLVRLRSRLAARVSVLLFSNKVV